MTVYFVSRHEGAQRWARFMQRQGLLPHDIEQYVGHLNSAEVGRGDIVIGTLPLAEVAAIRDRGARFLSLDLNIPVEYRGAELAATQMAAFGATLSEYRVSLKERIELGRPRGARRPRSAAPALTVMLVSQELMPQYLGYMHEPTPRVVLVVTDAMLPRFEALNTLLRKAPRPPERIMRLDLPGNCDFQELLGHAHSVVDSLIDPPPEKIVLNLTGGTKPMSLAFHTAGQEALKAGNPIVLQYVDTGHGRIDHMDDSPSQTMRPLLDVSVAVLASGKPPSGCGSSSPIFRQQMQRADMHGALLNLDPNVLGQLNKLGNEMSLLLSPGEGKDVQFLRRADGEEQRARAGIFHVVESNQTKLLGRHLKDRLGELLVDCGVLAARPETVDGAVRLQLNRPSEVDYIKGGWLEAHVASIAARTAPDDWASGVQIGAARGRNNEIDLIVASSNRTLLVEIKTSNLARGSASDTGEKSTKAQDALYKLDSIGHELARNFNENWLVSARPLSEPDLERAADKRIKVFAPDRKSSAEKALSRFESALQQWIAEGRNVIGRDSTIERAVLPVSSDWRKRGENDVFVSAVATISAQDRQSGHSIGDAAQSALMAARAQMRKR